MRFTFAPLRRTFRRGDSATNRASFGLACRSAVSKFGGVLARLIGRPVGSLLVRSARKPLCFIPEHRTVYSVLEAHLPLDIGVLAPCLHCSGTSSSGMWKFHIPQIRPEAVPNLPDGEVGLISGIRG